MDGYQKKNIINLSSLSREDLLGSFVEVNLKDAVVNDEPTTTFLSVRETLTRIGIASRKPAENGKPNLFQSCHILSKDHKSRYFIVHFKELFALDGRRTDFTYEDLGRRNTIANILAEWDLIDIIDQKRTQVNTVPLSEIKVIKHSEKDEWNLLPKYKMIGQRKDYVQGV